MTPPPILPSPLLTQFSAGLPVTTLAERSAPVGVRVFFTGPCLHSILKPCTPRLQAPLVFPGISQPANDCSNLLRISVSLTHRHGSGNLQVFCLLLLGTLPIRLTLTLSPFWFHLILDPLTCSSRSATFRNLRPNVTIPSRPGSLGTSGLSRPSTTIRPCQPSSHSEPAQSTEGKSITESTKAPT